MDSKGFIFSMDLLLALVIVTVAIGIASDQYELLNYQMQDFTGRQSLDKTVNDAADYLVKSSGNPTSWETTSAGNTTLPGLSSLTTFGSNPNFLDPKKVSKLDTQAGLLYNLVQTPNYDLKLVKTTNDNSWPTIIDIASPYPPTVSLANAKEVAVANRTVVVLSNQTQFSINDLTHINPAFPGNNTGNIWYNKSGQSYYVGPGNVTTLQDGNSSFYVSAEDLQNFDYYITIDTNTGVNVVQYGFTDGDAVVDGTYGDFADKDRKDAVDGALKDIYGNNGWLKLDNVNTGDLNNVNNDLQKVIDNGGGPDMKIWLNIESDPKDVLSISLIKVFKGQAPFQRIPAKLVLTIWE
jgi:hypothetical protein